MSLFEDLSRAVNHKLVTPYIPAGRIPSVTVDEQDAPEVARDHSSSWAAFIVYTDVKGVESMRRITCKRISGFGKA